MMREHQLRTKAAYESNAAGWTERTQAHQVEAAAQLRAETDGVLLDLGCGPGWHIPILAPAIGIDLTYEMTRLATAHGPVVNADMMALPLATQSIGGVWASRSLVHLPRTEVPMALAELHRVLAVDAKTCIWVFEGDDEQKTLPDDSLPGRTFSFWPPDLLARVFAGAGFEVEEMVRWTTIGSDQIIVKARRLWTLADTVGPNMRLMVCGLNPSPGSADSGVGFHRAGNRFWPAALQAGIVTRDRDPQHALAAHGIGMTDLVKRATRRADELTSDEYTTGLARVRHLVDWLEPDAVCMVGLSGWRASVDRKSQRGWQAELLGGRPVYVMPSTSGLNAHDTRDSLAAHLDAAMSGP